MLQNESAVEPKIVPESKIDPLSLAFRQDEISPWRQNLSKRFMEGFIGFWSFVGQHWLLILNVVNGFCLAMAFVAPLLSLAGLTGPADFLYGVFSYVCVQAPEHSFYIGGKQMCICQRCMSIYGGMLLAGLVFHLWREHAKPLKFWQFALFCVPIALDGFTQMFGWRQSTWELRLLTGAIFAVGLVWSLYPTMEAKMGRLRRWASREQMLQAE